MPGLPRIYWLRCIMTKTCRYCGVSATGTRRILQKFSKDSNYKFGVTTRCKRCDTLPNRGDVVGEYSLLTERPRPLRTCKCCGAKASSMAELKVKFGRKKQYLDVPSSYSPLCKRCEQVACLVLSEMTYVIRDGEEMAKGSAKYYALLEDLYTAVGYSQVPQEQGHPTDVLQFPLRYSLPDGTPFTKSAKRIWQIKIEAGYTILEEDDFE